MKDVKEELITDKKTDEFDYGLSDEIKEKLLEALENNLNNQFSEIFLDLHHADQADFTTQITSELRKELILIVGLKLDPEYFTYLENDTKNEIIEFLGAKSSANVIDKLEIDDAVHIISDLEDEMVSEILNYVSGDKRVKIEKALEYPESSVGRIMHENFVAIKKDWTVAEATKYLQEKENLPDDFDCIIVVDDNFSPISEILASKLIRSKKNTPIHEIMADKVEIKIFGATMEQKEVAELFSKYSLTYAPIVNKKNKLIGAIYANDLFSLFEEQKDASLYDFAGISDEENVNDKTSRKVSLRYKWLMINVFTAFMAAFVVHFFEHIISKYVLLAVYMPIVAGMGGNAATQTLAVMVRGIALKQIKLKTSLQTLKRELGSGFINGVINGVIVLIVVSFFTHDFKIALILATALIINLMVAAFFGTMVPLIMKHLGKDPATSATIFITTATDVLGFMVFLGLATLILS